MEANNLIGKINDMAIAASQGVSYTKLCVDLSQVTNVTTAKNRKKKEARTRKKAEETKKRLEEEELLATAAVKNAQFQSIINEKAPQIDIDEDAVAIVNTNALSSVLSAPGFASEIKVVLGKGRGVFATKDIQAGTKSLKETPLIASVGE